MEGQLKLCYVVKSKFCRVSFFLFVGNLNECFREQDKQQLQYLQHAELLRQGLVPPGLGPPGLNLPPGLQSRPRVPETITVR